MPVKRSKAVVNIKKNRLTITVAKKITKKCMDHLYTEIRFGVADLKPGFDVVTDLSECSLGALSGLPTFRKITNHLVSARVGRVVRVIDDTKVIKKQLLNIAARTQIYKADVFNSMEAADEFLSGAGQSEGLAFGLKEQNASYSYNGEEGTGLIESLSIHDCELYEVSLRVEQEGALSISIEFDSHEELLNRFEADAKVAWIEDDRFAVTFANVDESLQERLWERLVHESQCELS